MRTTVDIDEDVLAAAKELARLQRTTAGKLISRLLREALAGQHLAGATTPAGVGGFRPFPSRGVVVSDEIVDQLRDREGS